MSHRRSALLALLAALAAPGLAHAQVEVRPGDNAQEKVNSASPGQTVTFLAGNHFGPITVEDANITLKGVPGAVLAVTADDATAPVITFSAADGKVHDLTIFSDEGDGVVYGTGANQLLRSTVISTAKGTGEAPVAAVRVNSGNGTPAKNLTIDSSILKAQVAISAAYATPTAGGGGVTVAARHVTALGSTVANTSGATPPALLVLGSAPITITYTDSIVLGPRVAVAGDNRPEAKINAAAYPANIVADSEALGASLFIKPAGFNYRLRADAAAAIDKGGMTSGESATDVDGRERVSGAASDLGAAEFANRAPTASLAGPSSVRQGIAATFDASGSKDPDAAIGGGIVSYHWEFGDGSAADTTTPTVTHTFAERKQYSVTVTVTDRNGGTAASAPLTFTAGDGTVPTSATSQPGPKERMQLYNKRGKRKGITFFGTAEDDTALAAVFLTLRPIATKNGLCRWFDGKSKIVAGDCTKPALITAKLSGTDWRYKLPRRVRLPKGPYRLQVIPVDSSGLPGATETIDFRFR